MLNLASEPPKPAGRRFWSLQTSKGGEPQRPGARQCSKSVFICCCSLLCGQPSEFGAMCCGAAGECITVQQRTICGEGHSTETEQQSSEVFFWLSGGNSPWRRCRR